MKTLLSPHRHSRRKVLTGMTYGAATLATSRAGTTAATPALAATPDASPISGVSKEEVVALVNETMEEHHLKAAIVRVLIDGEEWVTIASGESMDGVLATPEMHFRNGAVAITYLSTALLILVDRGVVGLDDPLSTWLPELPDSDKATVRMLINMTAGYTDYVTTDAFSAANAADPFRHWTPEEIIAVSQDAGRFFEPGENWAYSHTDYVILGLALEQITGEPLDKVIRDLVLDPLGLVNTASFNTPEIPEPVLHAFTSERKSLLKIPPEVRFYEESTFWDPSWTIARGAIQTTNIVDLAASTAAIGEGVLLSPASYQVLTSKSLAGFGAPIEGCATCMTLSEQVPFGAGIWMIGDWLAQIPAFGGYAAFTVYLPARKLAIAVEATVNEAAFDDKGNFLLPNPSVPVGAAIAGLLAPEFPLAGSNPAP